eukprot:CAMPEP_0197541606 /NCGR_PEP_ID=MMETSP1318-20131121/67221_1 /TAXON_ID=552666 /ORGANISM="Partenskyella glossopodia, Strain RCC365" /LENGTH=677 /DNA_ID=CAMNT_0043100799 /DNA_START=68 /DNA_END=2101 /DNA_ORIENTATION=+
MDSKVGLPSNLGIDISFDALESMAKKAFAKRGEGVHWTCKPDQELPVKVSLDPNDASSHTPITVVEQFQECVAKHGSTTAMRVEREGKWIEWTYEQYFDDCCRVAKSLIKLGLTRFGTTVIMGFNSPEWFLADIGTIFAGGIASGIYTTNGVEATHYIADHCRAQIAFVEDDTQVAKFLECRDRLPHLKAIIQWTGKVRSGVPGLMSWERFMKIGEGIGDSELQDRISNQKPGNCCTLIYTSGTTGNPKAVMLSHDNVTWTSRTVTPILQLSDNERIVSYLPLSHIAAQLTDLHGPFGLGATVSFARPDALKGSLVDTLTAVRPTVFLGVPRVWEKIEEKMRAVGAANTGVIKKIGDWAKGVGLQSSRAKLEGKQTPFCYWPAQKIVFDKIKAKLGLDACKLCASGAAPIQKKTLEYFMSLDIILHDLYGMSESSGPHTINLPGANRIGTVGRAMPGAEMRLDRPDKNGEGEICMRGRHVFMGYLYNEEATLKTVDENGWLHSGDIGRIDSDGYLRITGRIKELIITAGGENVPPVLIEGAIKAALPAISNAVVIGDQRKYLSCLLTFKTNVDQNGVPTDELLGPGLELAKSVGSKAKTASAAAACPKIRKAIQLGIDKVNEGATSRAQRIRRWVIIKQDFSVDGGELTPTMKLKRRVVNDKYSNEIESMYPTEAKL